MKSEPFDTALVTADDRIIAGRSVDGDTAAFAVLMRRYAPMMRAYTGRILPDNSGIDDVVQDAFVTAWQRLPELENLDKVKSWLMRIASRKAIDFLRSNKKHQVIADLEPVGSAYDAPDRQTEARAGIEALSKALQGLPDVQRECWILKVINEYTYEEIATELDLPISTVRGLLARARKYLIVRMEQWR